MKNNKGGIMNKIELYDTTLRDGAQAQDVKFSAADKVRVAQEIDKFGVDYIEGGWPGANPVDDEFFELVKKVKFKNSILTAFGSTHRKDITAEEDPGVQALINAGTKVVTIFGKTDVFHVKNALQVSTDTNLQMIKNTILYLRKNGKRVFFDAEHFFDGYKRDREYALKCLDVAYASGAEFLILCDTNGGTLPDEVSKIVEDVVMRLPGAKLGIHAHNDTDCAVASTLAAVKMGAVQVQGTINGIGERCGNANLISVIPNLRLKLNFNCAGNLEKLKELSGFVSETANIRKFKRQPYVGESAFAHKGGIHASAVAKHPETYEHVAPELVGNERRILMSDLAGQSNLLRKAGEFSIELIKDSSEVKQILTEVKNLENNGYEFEGADASLELLIRKHLKIHKNIFFDIKGFRVIVERRNEGERAINEATAKIKIGDKVENEVAESLRGPVNALDKVLRKALGKHYPTINKVRLTDFKVRVLSEKVGTTAKVRVWIESGSNGKRWGTVGVSENIVEASAQALLDSLEYYLLKENGNNTR
jgi:2-isopropylmalate synthase